MTRLLSAVMYVVYVFYMALSFDIYLSVVLLLLA